MNNDDDINKILAIIGVFTVVAIIFFLIVCTVIQVGGWIDSTKSTCEVTVQKE